MLSSLACVLDVPLGTVLARTQGAEEQIIDPLAIGAARFRGIHPQEIFDICLSWGFWCCEIEVEPSLQFTRTDGEEVVIPIYAEPKARFDYYASRYNGILLGRMEGSFSGHAVAWKDKTIVDATGQYDSGKTFNVEALIIIGLTKPKAPSDRLDLSGLDQSTPST